MSDRAMRAARRIVYCSDIPGDVCCKDCHAWGGDLNIDFWLYACCVKEGILKEAGVDIHDNAAVRAWIDAQVTSAS